MQMFAHTESECSMSGDYHLSSIPLNEQHT